MSQAVRQLYRARLKRLLARADDRGFLQLCWATRALQTGRVDTARRYIDFPEAAADPSLTSRLAIYPWYIETLVNELLVVDKERRVDGRRHLILNTQAFAAMAEARNLLRSLENAEDGLTLRRINVLREMYRLTQRQFEWQRGFLSRSGLYRSARLYGGSLADGYFRARTGLSVQEFAYGCFAFHALFKNRPTVHENADYGRNDLPLELSRAVIRHLSLPLEEARDRTRQLRQAGGHVGYKPSILRTKPCISFGDEAIAPLAELVMLRGMGGLVYDLEGAPGNVRNEVALSFERYCADLFVAMMPTVTVRPSFKYRFERNNVDSPDVMLFRGKRLELIVECKATRMSFGARFAENPLVEGGRGYDEMANGVFQIWRFASRIRRGLVPGFEIAEGTLGLVVTLDSWLETAGLLVADVIVKAHKLAAERDPLIAEEDKIPVRFSMIDDVENTLAIATEQSFFDVVAASVDKEHRGWLLETRHQELLPQLTERRDYPFAHRIGEVQGRWWQRIEEVAASRVRAPAQQ